MQIHSTLNFSQISVPLIEPEKSDSVPHRTFKRWTIEEDQCLLRGIQKFGNNWEKIADTYFKISPGAFSHKDKSCYNRYMKYWRKSHTLDEIEAISEPIKVIHLKNSDRVIANLLPQGDSQNFANFYLSELSSTIQSQLALSFENTQQTLSPSSTQDSQEKASTLADRKGKHWKKAEDEQLLRGIQEFGANWRAIEEKYFPPSEQNSDSESYRRYYHRYSKYWKKFYSIEQICSISEPIRVTGLKTSARKIANLASFSQPSEEIKPVQSSSSVPIAISSHTQESAMTSPNNMATVFDFAPKVPMIPLQPNVPSFSLDLEIAEDWDSPRYVPPSLFDSEGEFIKPDILDVTDMLGINE